MAWFKAAKEGNVELLESFLESGDQDIDETDEDGNSALHWAASWGQKPALKFLLDNNIDVDSKNNSDDTPMEDAASSKHWDIVSILLDHGADVEEQNQRGGTVLHDAAMDGQFAIVESICSDNKSICLRADKRKRIPFDVAKDGPTKKILQDYTLCAACSAGDVARVKSLLGSFNSASLSACRAEGGDGPLHYAAAAANLDIMKLLIDAGMDVDAENFNNASTPLFDAFYGDHEWKTKERCIRFLLDHGADINKTGLQDEGDDDGIKAFMFAIHGARGLPAEAFPLLVEYNADLNYVQGESGDTLAHHAARRNNYVVLETLIEHGGNATITNQRGHTPLHVAVWNGALESAQLLIPLYKETGLSLDAGDENGSTYLILAAKGRSPELVKLLLEAGAEVSQRDTAQKTALDYVSGSTEVRQVLENGARMTCDDDHKRTQRACDRFSEAASF